MYSIYYCLHGVLPLENFSCWAFLLPSITALHLEKSDKSLCKAFEELYNEENCTPNMHMHLHVKQSVLNYVRGGGGGGGGGGGVSYLEW